MRGAKTGQRERKKEEGKLGKIGAHALGERTKERVAHAPPSVVTPARQAREKWQDDVWSARANMHTPPPKDVTRLRCVTVRLVAKVAAVTSVRLLLRRSSVWEKSAWEANEWGMLRSLVERAFFFSLRVSETGVLYWPRLAFDSLSGSLRTLPRRRSTERSCAACVSSGREYTALEKRQQGFHRQPWGAWRLSELSTLSPWPVLYSFQPFPF